MTLKDKIQADIKASMLNKDVNKLSLLRVLKGEIENISKRLGDELSDEDILKIIKKMKENAELMKNDSEIEILNEYLPVVLGEKQTETIVAGIITKNKYHSMKDMGKVMSELKKYGTQIDSKISSQIVKRLLTT